MTGASGRRRGSVVRRSPPVASSAYFAVRMLPSDGPLVVQVTVPVRVEAKAAHRNRIRRQVAEAFRVVLKQTPTRYHVAIMVRRSDIPQGQELRRTVFELMKESGMMERR